MQRNDIQEANNDKPAQHSEFGAKGSWGKRAGWSQSLEASYDPRFKIQTTLSQPAASSMPEDRSQLPEGAVSRAECTIQGRMYV